MNTMQYKGYTARIGFDDRDNVIVGCVPGVRAIICSRGKSVAECTAPLNSLWMRCWRIAPDAAFRRRHFSLKP